MFQKKKDTEGLDVLSRRSTDKLGEISTKIGENQRIKGEIEGKENIRLEGAFDGKAEIKGLFVIGDTGKFKGELTADNIIVEGDFDGNANAKKKIELMDGSHFKGNIVSTTIAFAEGCFFEGEIKMQNSKGESFSFEEKRKIKT